MCKIYINDELVMETVLPSYVYWDGKIESFRTCDEEQAEAVYITQEIPEDTINYYADIDVKPYRHTGFPIARIEKE